MVRRLTWVWCPAYTALMMLTLTCCLMLLTQRHLPKPQVIRLLQLLPRAALGLMRLWFDFWSRHHIYCLLVYIICFPTYSLFFIFSLLISSHLSFHLRIDALRFQAGCRKRRLNLALVFLCLFCVVVHFFWLMSACSFCVTFSFSIPCQQIGLGKRHRNDLFCVEWDVNPQLSQLLSLCYSPVHLSVRASIHAYIQRRRSLTGSLSTSGYLQFYVVKAKFHYTGPTGRARTFSQDLGRRPGSLTKSARVSDKVRRLCLVRSGRAGVVEFSYYC